MDEGKLRKIAERKVDKNIRSGIYSGKKKYSTTIKFKTEPKKDVVPIRIDAKTVIYVEKSKCKFIDGKWMRK
jgi:hypothetical protein